MACIVTQRGVWYMVAVMGLRARRTTRTAWASAGRSRGCRRVSASGCPPSGPDTSHTMAASASRSTQRMVGCSWPVGRSAYGLPTNLEEVAAHAHAAAVEGVLHLPLPWPQEREGVVRDSGREAVAVGRNTERDCEEG